MILGIPTLKDIKPGMSLRKRRAIHRHLLQIIHGRLPYWKRVATFIVEVNYRRLSKRNPDRLAFNRMMDECDSYWKRCKLGYASEIEEWFGKGYIKREEIPEERRIAATNIADTGCAYWRD